MASRKKKKKKRARRLPVETSSETNLGDTITIAWTVTVTTLFLCNLTNILVHFYVDGNPAAKGMVILQKMLLLSGAIIGVLSLLLIPVVYRLRQVPPPLGLVAFGVCCAVAPLLALLVQAWG